MNKAKYIVTRKQIMEAVDHGISEVIPDEIIRARIYSRIDYAIETVLEDDCDEYIEGEQEKRRETE